MTLLLVGLGAAVGAPLRYLISHLVDVRWHWGTLVVNITGSFALGVVVAEHPSTSTMALLGTGFCGGYTTYSSFAVQAVNAGRRRGPLYVVATLVGCLGTAWLGLHV